MEDPEWARDRNGDGPDDAAREEAAIERIRQAVARGIKDADEGRVQDLDAAFDELEAEFRSMIRRA